MVIRPGAVRRWRDQHEKPYRKINRSDWNFVIPHLKKHKKILFVTAFITVLSSLLSLVPPLITRTLIDNEITKHNVNGIIFYALILLLLYGISFAFTSISSRTLGIATQRLIYDVRNSIYKKIIHSSIQYNNDSKRGQLLSVVINDVDTLSDAISSGVIDLLSSIISFVGAVVLIFILEWRLAIISLIIVPLLYFSVAKLRKRIRMAYVTVRNRIGELNASVEENLSGIRVIQSLAMEDKNSKNFEVFNKNYFESNMKAFYIFSIFSGIVSINGFISIALVVGIGGYCYIQGWVTLGVLVAFVQYINLLIRPLVQIAQLGNTFESSAAALIHISDYLKIPEDVPEPNHPAELPKKINGDIELRNITFSYTEIPFIKNLNLNIRSGEKVGIVGETGAGKSTLINLITRLYDVQAGGVYIDGIDVKTIRSQDLRALMGSVSQNVVIFSDSILNNIRFSKLDATDEEIRTAAKNAHADTFIMNMPHQYETVLGEGGIGLSGGQKQLISYARMLLAQPKIIILDEATSNIDSYTEDIIQENMAELLVGCTTIIIAHRFATLKNVDRIIVIRDGKIHAIGNHESLLQTDEYYKKLYEIQYSKY